MLYFSEYDPFILEENINEKAGQVALHSRRKRWAWLPAAISGVVSIVGKFLIASFG